MDGHQTGHPQGTGEQNPAYRLTHRHYQPDLRIQSLGTIGCLLGAHHPAWSPTSVRQSPARQPRQPFRTQKRPIWKPWSLLDVLVILPSAVIEPNSLTAHAQNDQPNLAATGPSARWRPAGGLPALISVAKTLIAHACSRAREPRTGPLRPKSS